MEENIILEKDNITYYLNLKLVSNLIVFHIETNDIPKKIYENSFSKAKMRNNYKCFSLYKNIESIYELLKDSIKEPSRIKIEEKNYHMKLKINSTLINSQPLYFIIGQKDYINDKISELFFLYEELKNEKEKEINDLIQKNEEQEEKFIKMDNEIKNLREEIKNLKEQIKEDKTELELEIDYVKKKNDFKNLNEIQNKNIGNELIKSEQVIAIDKDKFTFIEELIRRNKKSISSLQNQIFFLTFNNFHNFKTLCENYYNSLAQDSTSCLFTEHYKISYDNIVNILFEHIKRNNCENNNKIMEYSGGLVYENYTKENWNAFVINNVIYQMIFCGIKLSEDGIDEALENIYKLYPEFKRKFKSELELSKNDIQIYLKDFKLAEVIRGIKSFKNLNTNLLPEEKVSELTENEWVNI